MTCLVLFSRLSQVRVPADSTLTGVKEREESERLELLNALDAL